MTASAIILLVIMGALLRFVARVAVATVRLVAVVFLAAILPGMCSVCTTAKAGAKQDRGPDIDSAAPPVQVGDGPTGSRSQRGRHCTVLTSDGLATSTDLKPRESLTGPREFAAATALVEPTAVMSQNERQGQQHFAVLSTWCA